ncbi:NLP effector protein 2 [Paramyrothecium foliicola]|nr:NLP effector protein 2 [Paramyrothecium foliicola]
MYLSSLIPLLGFAALGNTSPLVLQPRQIRTANHDSLNPVSDTIQGGNIGRAIRMFQPVLHVASGCQPYTAVTPAGVISAGLDIGGAIDGGCRDRNKGQTYARAKVLSSTRLAILYAWYFPKDQVLAGSGGHSNDWEGVVVFIDNYNAANPTLFSAAASSHGNWKKTRTPQIRNKNVMAEYFAFLGTHEIQFKTSPGRSYWLYDWDAMTSAAKNSLEGFNFGSANVPFINRNFDRNINMATIKNLWRCLVLSTLASAHFVITYPGWRGNTLHRNDDFPNGMQNSAPCGGIPETQNRTAWPLNRAGVVALQPGWFAQNRYTQFSIRLGLDGSESEFPYLMRWFRAIGPSDNPFPGTICLPDIFLPQNVRPANGDTATIQIIQLHEASGRSAHNCIDIFFTDDATELPIIDQTNCFNSTEIRIQGAEEFAIASSTSTAPSPATTSPRSNRDMWGWCSISATRAAVYGSRVGLPSCSEPTGNVMSHSYLSYGALAVSVLPGLIGVNALFRPEATMKGAQLPVPPQPEARRLTNSLMRFFGVRTTAISYLLVLIWSSGDPRLTGLGLFTGIWMSIMDGLITKWQIGGGEWGSWALAPIIGGLSYGLLSIS